MVDRYTNIARLSLDRLKTNSAVDTLKYSETIVIPASIEDYRLVNQSPEARKVAIQEDARTTFYIAPDT